MNQGVTDNNLKQGANQVVATPGKTPGDSSIDEEDLKSAWLISSSTSSFKQNFDFLIIICVIFNCFSIPIEIAFDPKVMRSKPFFTLNCIVDLLFFVDIIICFRATYVNQFGIEIVDP